MMHWCLILDFISFCKIDDRENSDTKIDTLSVIIINRESNQHHIRILRHVGLLQSSIIFHID